MRPALGSTAVARSGPTLVTGTLKGLAGGFVQQVGLILAVEQASGFFGIDHAKAKVHEMVGTGQPDAFDTDTPLFRLASGTHFIIVLL